MSLMRRVKGNLLSGERINIERWEDTRLFQIILILFVVGIISMVLQWLWKAVKPVAVLLVGAIALCLCIALWRITLPLIILAFVICGYVYHKAKKEIERLQMQNINWIESHGASYTTDQVDRILAPFVQEVYDQDQNFPDYKFIGSNIPYGRANAFLNYFNRNIFTEEPYYYTCYPSKDENEFREYGMMITRSGIFVSEQFQTDKNSEYSAKNHFLPFTGLRNVSVSNSRIQGVNVRLGEFDNLGNSITVANSFMNVGAIQKLCQAVINSRISVALLVDQVVDRTYAESRVQMEEERFFREQQGKMSDNVITAAAIGSSAPQYRNLYAETKGYMNGSQGGGYGAEYANNTFDRLKGMQVESTAQVLDEHGRQVKAGADRTVNGWEVQTKYYKTAAESIGAAFEKGQAVYIRSDGSGKMMQIEVPRDQYQEAIKIMQKRIDNGEVPNVNPGEDASDYVRKGYYTYSQAWNVCKAGTIESLTVDITEGVICTTSAAGISAVITFAKGIWRGESIEKAAREGLETGVRIMGKGVIIYTATMQLTRKEFTNFTNEYLKGGVLKGVGGIANPIYELSENLASSIQVSSLAQSQIGEMLGLNDISAKNLVSGTITAAVVFGPDICKALEGKISVEQLLKNSIVAASGLAAAGIGQALCPIPMVGAMIGGYIGGIVMKNFMDKISEDDAIKMFRILKEEFLDQVVLAELTKEEFDEVVSNTVGHPELPKILQNMYASGEYREYARVSIVEEVIVRVVANRPKVKQETYDFGMGQILRGAV